MAQSVQHLTVRELDEAIPLGLTPQAYDEVRERIRAQVAEALTKDLRSQVRAEVETETREKAKAAFDKEARAGFEKKVREELMSEVPHEKDLKASRDFAREVGVTRRARWPRRSWRSYVGAVRGG